MDEINEGDHWGRGIVLFVILLIIIGSCSSGGSDPVQLTDWSGFEWAGGWSPDGSRILISGDPDGVGGQDVFVVDADGSNRVQLTDWPGDEYAGGWSPDGSHILISGNRHSSEWGKDDVYVIRVFSQ